MPSTFTVLLPFIIAFVLASWQYYVFDPERRILNIPFGLLAGSAAAITIYPVYVQLNPGNRDLAWLLLVLGVVWLALTFWVRRRIKRSKAS